MHNTNTTRFAFETPFFRRQPPHPETKNLQTPIYGARMSRFSILAEIAVKNLIIMFVAVEFQIKTNIK